MAVGSGRFMAGIVAECLSLPLPRASQCTRLVDPLPDEVGRSDVRPVPHGPAHLAAQRFGDPLGVRDGGPDADDSGCPGATEAQSAVVLFRYVAEIDGGVGRDCGECDERTLLVFSDGVTLRT